MVKLTIYVEVDPNELPRTGGAGCAAETERTVLDEVVSNLQSLDYVTRVRSAVAQAVPWARFYAE